MVLLKRKLPWLLWTIATWPWPYVSVVRLETTRVRPRAPRQARRSESEPVGLLLIAPLLSLSLLNDPVNHALLHMQKEQTRNPESYTFIPYMLYMLIPILTLYIHRQVLKFTEQDSKEIRAEQGTLTAYRC